MPPSDTPPWFPIETERLILRDPREEDFDDIHAYARLDEVVRYMAWGPNTPAMTREALDRWLDEAAVWPRDGVNLVVEHKAQERVIGAARLTIQDPVHRTANFGYTFHPDAWGRGIGTEAARALVGAAFGPLGLHRVWATCDVENTGSWRIMEKLGMRREGTFLKHLNPRGAWRDTHLYALLAEEWGQELCPGIIDKRRAMKHHSSMSTSNRREMIRAYKEAKRPCGVFALRCAPTGEAWIGASANLAAQENALRFTLKMGKHPNKGLEAAIRAHGPEAFAYEVLETVADEDLTAMGRADELKRRVAHWIEALAAKPLIGAN